MNEDRERFLFALLLHNRTHNCGMVTAYRVDGSNIYLYGRKRNFLKSYRLSLIDGLISGDTNFRTQGGKVISATTIQNACESNRSLYQPKVVEAIPL